MLPALNLGYPWASPRSCISEVCSGWAGTSSPGPFCLQRVWQPRLCTLQSLLMLLCRRNILCPARGMETLFAQYLVGPGHRLVFIQSQTGAWADPTCVFDVKYHGKLWDSGLHEAKPNPQVSIDLKCFQKSQLALTSRPDSSPNPVCKQRVQIIAIYIPVFYPAILSDLLIFSDWIFVCNTSWDKSMQL